MFALKIITFCKDLFMFFMTVWIVCSWVPALQKNGIYWRLDRFFDSILKPIRRFVPLIGGMDISPIALMFMIHIAYSILRRLLS